MHVGDMGPRMNTAPRRIALALALSLVALAPGATAAAAAPAAPAVDPIIVLPLQPIVPAALRSCTAKTASGLGYSVLKAADGPKPGQTDYVLLEYIGYLAATGTTFDQNQRAPLSLESVIPGFAEGLQLMPRGSTYRLCIPAAIGYGAQASGPIPANSDLVFQVTLLDSKTVAEVAAMQKQAPPAEGAAPKP